MLALIARRATLGVPANHVVRSVSLRCVGCGESGQGASSIWRDIEELEANLILSKPDSYTPDYVGVHRQIALFITQLDMHMAS